MSNYVFLIDQNKTPLMPVSPRQARKLLDSGKAAVFRHFPFVLILKRSIKNALVHPLTLKIDPGSKTTGFALVSDREEVVWRMQLQHRGGQIREGLTHRLQMRRHRRYKLRYRKPGLPTHKKPKGWLAPSLLHRVLTTQTWVQRVLSFCPVEEVWVERVKFDTQLMQNPDIEKAEYQKGTLKGYTVREYLLEKWGRKCAYCSKTSVPLQIEHIYPVSKGGSNRVSNLCLACEQCNLKKGDRLIEQFLLKKPDLLRAIQKQSQTPLADAAAVNSTRNCLVKALETRAPVKTYTGAQTKMNRIRLGLPKEHDLDAACVGPISNLRVLSEGALIVKSVGTGGRQRCITNKHGYPVSHRPLRPIHGYRSGDLVSADIPKGKNKGEYIGKLYPRSSGNGQIVLKGGAQIHVSKLSYILKVIHSKDGYSYL